MKFHRKHNSATHDISNRRPLALYLLSGLLIGVPVINYLAAALKMAAIPDLQNAENIWGLAGLAFLLTGPVVGVAIILARKLAWYSFISYSAALVFYNVYHLAVHPDRLGENLPGLFISIAALGALAYFFNKDIKEPMLEGRPWRISERFKVALDVVVDRVQLKTLNASATGMFILWDQCPFFEGEKVNVTVPDGQGEFQIRASVIRKTPDGIAIHYGKLSIAQRARLLPLINEMRRSPRTDMDVGVDVGGYQVRIANLNRNGMFVNWMGCEQSVGAANSIKFPPETGLQELHGEIVRVEPHGVALRFIDASEDAKKDLDRFGSSHKVKTRKVA